MCDVISGAIDLKFLWSQILFVKNMISKTYNTKLKQSIIFAVSDLSKSSKQHKLTKQRLPLIYFFSRNQCFSALYL